ncbi:AI-2E family transporter [Halopiger xanaduensis]|uniref:Permease protein n=1 Tax=Halopiger xanaduensis (strain DSM 18323 / JCM 14033 / SH-6) TaxID=797210 RepID=F8DCM1_HALXS|nr:AI-2E family transporter [Halopiger xanaduensis]AEH36065.1 protein of unknown function UPF0118 [Halopiger xanaduensis SH-6]
MSTNTKSNGPPRSGSRRRRYVLAGVVALLGIVTGAILLEVLGTILFALTVAYVLLPLQGWLVRRGLTEWVAAAAATVIGFVGAVAVFSPIAVTLYFRVDEITSIIEGLPEAVPITAFNITYTIEASEVQAFVVDYLSSIAATFALSLPVLAIKFALFLTLLFALLLEADSAGRAAIAPIPREYRDVVYALATRARETLYAIYVLQLATSVATLLIAYPVFWLLDYEMSLTLAIIAAILQFVPIVGPSVLVGLIAVYHVTAGEIAAAVLIAVFGLVLIGWLPDIAVRPRLARRSAGLPGSLYFIGFTGGLFTLGPIGIVVGPLIVAVFVEAVDLLSEEVNSEITFSELAAAESDAGGDSGTEPRPDEPDSPIADD